MSFIISTALSTLQKSLKINSIVSALALLVFIVTITACNDSTSTAPKITSIDTSGPKIQSWTTKSGSKVLFVPSMQLPMLDIRVVFDAGAARDGAKLGLALITNAMLDQGAKLGAIELSTNDIAERIDSIGARLSNSSLKDMALISLRTLTDDTILAKSLETFGAVLQAPTFPEKDFERTRKQILIAISAESQSPGKIANKLFYKNLFDSHVYSHSNKGTKASIAALTVQDLKDFYAKYYVAKNATIVLVGQLSITQATEIAENLSKGLLPGEQAKQITAAPRYPAAKIISEQFPSSQTHIIMGNIGMRRGDKDYFALYIGNHILGGSGFSSRIVDEIREKRGLAYSSYSHFVPMRVAGPFSIGMQTKNEQTRQAIEVLNQVLVTFINDGPTEQELLHSKQNITGSFPLRIDSNREIVEYLAMIGFYNLPLDYLEKFNATVNAISVAQIKDAFSRRIDPKKLLTVIVGDLSKQK